MKNIIKKGLILFLFNLFLPIQGISQTTSGDTLKAISLIFSEHEKLSIENPLLKQQIKYFEEYNKLYVKTDSIKNEEIKSLQNEMIYKTVEMKNLESTQKKFIIFSSINGIILFIIGLLL